MTLQNRQPWRPTAFKRFEKAYDTSVGTARIVTDAGEAYIKCLGNRQGPHVLACEWVGTQLAELLGLPTLDYAILALTDDDEIPLIRGGTASPGPAFVTRAVVGNPWSGNAAELDLLDNLDDLSRLVLFDTWTLNCDRHPAVDPKNPTPYQYLPRKPNPDNVLLCAEGATPGRFRVVAMDHTHCFTCGGDLTDHIADIDRTRDERIYGLFPAFRSRMNERVVRETAARLAGVTVDPIQAIIDALPDEWQVPGPARQALVRLVHERAAFVADNIVTWLRPLCWPQGTLPFAETGDAE